MVRLLPPAALLLVAIFALTLAVTAWERRRIPGAGWIAATLAAGAIWSLVYAFEIIVPVLPGKLVAATVEYVGIATLPVCWFAAVVHYTGRARLLTRRVLAALLVVPAITLGLVASNELHHLIWTSAKLPLVAPGELVVGHGSWFWVHAAYSFVLVGAGSAVLARALFRLDGRYRRQSALLALAAAAPIVASIAHLAGFAPLGLDPTPFAAILTGAGVLACMRTLGVLDLARGLVPVARDSIVAIMRDGLLVLYPDGRLADVNLAAEQMLGLEATLLIGSEARDALIGWPPEVFDTRGDEELRREFTVGPAGSLRHYDVLSSPIVLRRGEPAGRLVVVRDVSGSKRVEHALRSSEQRYRDLVENATDTIFTIDLAGSFTSLNEAGEVLLGYSNEEICALHLQDVVVGTEGTRLAALARSEGGVTDVHVLRHDGDRIALEISARMIHEGGVPIGIQAIARDVTERRRFESLLRHQALYDGLTGLPNREYLHESLAASVSEARESGGTVALLLLDLDGFKEVNDTFGHQHGDLLLEQIARRLEPIARGYGLVARLGGDEFALVIPGGEAVGAELIAARIVDDLDEPITLLGRAVRVGTSVGIALYPEHGEEAGELLRRADIAMYQAKRSRSGHRLYAAENDDNTPTRLELGTELRSAVERDELVLFYQPQVCVQTGRVMGVEALIRWRHPRHGLLAPDAFIPLAESSGMILPITRWVLETAIRECAPLRETGSAIDLAVNLSPRALHDPELPGVLARLAEQIGPTASRLKLELTETTIATDPEHAARLLAELRSFGIGIAIDDFGTGYGSLTYLRDLPIDEIKIDRSFVREANDDGPESAIVRAIVALARELDITVIAEGVETREMLERVTQLGCDSAQGYFLGRPQPIENLLFWLADKRAA